MTLTIKNAQGEKEKGKHDALELYVIHRSFGKVPVLAVPLGYHGSANRGC